MACLAVDYSRIRFHNQTINMPGCYWHKCHAMARYKVNSNSKLLAMTLDPGEPSGFDKGAITMKCLNKLIEWVSQKTGRIDKDLKA
nr:hypothetical protein [uncultured Cohaesibacter sp.]